MTEVNTKDILDNLLKKLMDITEEIKMIGIINRNGNTIASITSMQEDNVSSSVTTSFNQFIERMKAEFSDEDFINITTLGENKFFFTNAGENAILIMLGTSEAKDQQMKVYGKFCSDKIKVILDDNENISLDFPPILTAMTRFSDGKLPSGLFVGKVIVCGDYGVGKTSLVKRFVDQSFKEAYISTIGVDISKKKIEIEKDCNIQYLIWDIAGQIKTMAPYRKNFYNGANAAFIVYSKTRRSSFENIKTWLKDMAPTVGNIPKILIGNKNDLVESFEVNEDDIKNLAEELGMNYIETSAKTGENVDYAFKYIGYQLIK